MSMMSSAPILAIASLEPEHAWLIITLKPQLTVCICVRLYLFGGTHIWDDIFKNTLAHVAHLWCFSQPNFATRFDLPMEAIQETKCYSSIFLVEYNYIPNMLRIPFRWSQNDKWTVWSRKVRATETNSLWPHHVETTVLRGPFHSALIIK